MREHSRDLSVGQAGLLDAITGSEPRLPVIYTRVFRWCAAKHRRCGWAGLSLDIPGMHD